MLRPGETDSNTVTVEDLNTALSTTDRSSRQKINKEKQALNDTGTERQLIFRVFHPKAAEYTFFSSALGTFSRADNMLGHKASLGKFKKIEIISGIFSNHNTIRLGINYMKKKKTCRTNKHVEVIEYVTNTNGSLKI